METRLAENSRVVPLLHRVRVQEVLGHCASSTSASSTCFHVGAQKSCDTCGTGDLDVGFRNVDDIWSAFGERQEVTCFFYITLEGKFDLLSAVVFFPMFLFPALYSTSPLL